MYFEQRAFSYRKVTSPKCLDPIKNLFMMKLDHFTNLKIFNVAKTKLKLFSQKEEKKHLCK